MGWNFALILLVSRHWLINWLYWMT
jgi:hypothetical protein